MGKYFSLEHVIIWMSTVALAYIMLAVYVVHKTLSEFEGKTFGIQSLCQDKINRKGKGKECRSTLPKRATNQYVAGYLLNQRA